MDLEPYWSRDGHYFVSWNQQKRDITIWNINHGKMAVNESSYKETFTEKSKSAVLFIIVLSNMFCDYEVHIFVNQAEMFLYL